MLPRFAHQFTATDRLPELAGVLRGVDLTGQTVTIVVERPSGNLTKTATITDAAGGCFVVSWSVGDLEVGLGQRCTIFLTDASSRRSTVARFAIDVCEEP